MSESNGKPKISLITFSDLGLIIPFSSGVIYTNQVGGLSCFHPEVEGVFAPLPVGVSKTLFTLQQHFQGNWHHINEEDAKIVDRILRRNDLEYLQVDKSNLENSFEAWVYVEIQENKEIFSLLEGFEKKKGILTWLNSD